MSDGKGWRIGFWNVAGLRNKDRLLERADRLGCDSVDGNVDG